MPDATEEGTPLLGRTPLLSPVRPRRLFEERRGCCSSPLIICVGLSLGVWLSVRAQAQAPPGAGTIRTSAATPPSSVEQSTHQPPVVPQQYDEVPVPTVPRAALPRFDEVPVPRTALPRFDGSLEAALRAAVPAGRPRFLLLTFGNAAIGPLLRNFALHCRRAGIPHVVGAVDVGAFELLAASDGEGSLQGSRAATPVYKTPLALRGAYKMDGGNSHSSSSWKQFAAMRTGEVARVVEAGYDVLHTDTDVVWLRDPSPYLLCTEEAACPTCEFAPASRLPCAALRTADVAVSSDNMGPGLALRQGAGYAAGGTFNSGILLFRATPAGMRFVRAWHANVAHPPQGSRFARLTSDQQVFNNMVRKPREWPGVRAAPGNALMTVDASCGPWAANLSLGYLPLPLFANGHGYFVQAAHRALGVRPMAVHATYSLDRHDGLAKTQRFREAGLWHADPERYFQGKYLALNFSLPPQLVDSAATSHIGTHRAALAGYVAELRDALALARALRRTLVLPRWRCFCDRLWAGSDNILAMGCMYPGSQRDPFLPFDCPMDHVLSPTDWRKAAGFVDYRDAAFLASPRLAATLQRAVDVRVLPREAYDALPRAARTTARTAVLPQGTSTSEVVALLATHSDAPLVRLQHARGLLCSVAEGEAKAFNRQAAPLLRVPPWCSRCHGDRGCAKNLRKWLSPEQISHGRAHGDEWCMTVPPPPPFERGRCVLNQG